MRASCLCLSLSLLLSAQAQVECDDYCATVIECRQKDKFIEPAPLFQDVATFSPSGDLAALTEGLIGGFPCQAGLHKVIAHKRLSAPLCTVVFGYCVTPPVPGSVTSRSWSRAPRWKGDAGGALVPCLGLLSPRVPWLLSEYALSWGHFGGTSLSWKMLERSYLRS